MADTERLIAALAKEAAPVGRLLPPGIRVACWAAVGAGILGAALLRASSHGALEGFAHPLRAGGLATALVVAGCSGYAAVLASVPGASHRALPRASFALLAASGVSLLLMVAGRAASGREAFETGTAWHCLSGALLFSLVPIAVLLMVVRRGLSLAPRRAAALALLGGSSVGVAALQLLCPDASPFHLLISHWSAPIVAAALGALALHRVASPAP